MNEECKNCAAMETCITACEYGSIMCMMNRIRTGQTKGALKKAEAPPGSETAALRQQIAEKEKEIENWRNRLHDMININGKIADQLAQVIAERDVAIADLPHVCSICGRDRDSLECADCRGNDDAWNTCVDHWEWRGLQKEADSQ